MLRQISVLFLILFFSAPASAEWIFISDSNEDGKISKIYIDSKGIGYKNNVVTFVVMQNFVERRVDDAQSMVIVREIACDKKQFSASIVALYKTQMASGKPYFILSRESADQSNAIFKWSSISNKTMIEKIWKEKCVK
jgi:hypothetical protein